MKILYFLIIIAIIYFFALQIKVVHIDALPNEYRDKLASKSKIREMFFVNNLVSCENDHLKSYDENQQENFQQIGGHDNRYELPVRVKLDLDNADTQKLCYKQNHNSSHESILNQNKINSKYDNQQDPYQTNILWLKSLPDATNLIELIKNEYMESKYRFNVANLPVTTRYSNASTLKLDKKYIKHVRNNIKSWNEIFNSFCKGNKKIIIISGIRPIFIMETDHEFIIKVLVKIYYQNRSMHLELTYYGEIDTKDDFDNWGSDSYIIQLTSLRPIIKTEYEQNIRAMDAQEIDRSGPFLSMKDQMEYVDQINKMHHEEIYNF